MLGAGSTQLGGVLSNEVSGELKLAPIMAPLYVAGVAKKACNSALRA